MEFGSKYIYNYGFDGSDLDSLSEDDESDIDIKKKKKIRKPDTNILRLNLDSLIKSNDLIDAELIQCLNCSAALSVISYKNIATENDNSYWHCEFCSYKNDITTKNFNYNLNEEGNTYVIKPSNDTKNPNHDKKLTNEGYISFCIDLSDSMCTKIQVNNKSNTDISRLDGVKLACIDALKMLKNESPYKKVAMITFANSVRFYGDSTKLNNNAPLVDTIKYVDTDNLIIYEKKIGLCERITRFFNLILNRQQYNFDSIFNDTERKMSDIHFDTERLFKLAQEQNGDLLGINETFEKLTNLIKSLKTQSFTALGPSLAFAIGFSSKIPGSEVILCTDGCGNVGVGNEDDLNRADIFYRMLADYARAKNVRINVVSIRGEDCKLALLCKLVDRTNGSMSIVNPSKISQELKSILDNSLIATDVKMKLFVDKKFMYIRDDELEREEDKLIRNNNVTKRYLLNEYKKSIVFKDIGNVNVDNDLMFEYGIRMQKAEAIHYIIKELPFQVQISYKALDGSERVKVVTKLQELTIDRKMSESNLDKNDFIWLNGIKKISENLFISNVELAKFRDKSLKKFAKKNKLELPEGFVKNSELVKTIPNDKKMFQLDDRQTLEIYRAKNKSLKYLKENEFTTF